MDKAGKGVPSCGRSDADLEFYRYYAEQSISAGALQRFNSIRRVVMQQIANQNRASTVLDVADVGCNAGTQCTMWARDGHRVHGLDINDLLLELASKRAAQAGVKIDYVLGSATELPWPDQSMDVCLVPELLEHVADWRTCLDEFTRVLRPNGIIYLSTTNYLCPKQQEFNLPLYSWYPSILKERYERLAMSSRPELANNAKYPAVNWFSFYSLRSELAVRGMRCLDRFDAASTEGSGTATKLVLGLIRKTPPLRFMGHVATPYTVVLGVKDPTR